MGDFDQMQEMVKDVTSNFQKPFTYKTVNTDRKGISCTIPERCLWWLAKVEEGMSRFLIGC